MGGRGGEGHFVLEMLDDLTNGKQNVNLFAEEFLDLFIRELVDVDGSLAALAVLLGWSIFGFLFGFLINGRILIIANRVNRLKLIINLLIFRITN